MAKFVRFKTQDLSYAKQSLVIFEREFSKFVRQERARRNVDTPQYKKQWLLLCDIQYAVK